MTTISIPRGSTEYLEATITADVPLSMSVELAITRGSAAHVWLPATWQGTAGTTRTARTSSPVTFGGTYPEASYSIYARLTDTPEVPIIRVGSLYISG